MNLFARFEVLEDPRDERGKKYRLIDIMIMTIYGILSKHEDFNNIAYLWDIKQARRFQQHSVLFRIEQRLFCELVGNRVRKNTKPRLSKRCIRGNKTAEIHGSIRGMDKRYSKNEKWKCNQYRRKSGTGSTG